MRPSVCLLAIAVSCRQAPAPVSDAGAPLDGAKDAAIDVGSPRDAAESGGAPQTRGPCPSDMVHVAGTFCPYVGHRCVEWIDQKRDRCQRYAPPPLCEGRLTRLEYCIDRYEYPNQVGVLPAVMVSYTEALVACGDEGKRLCTEDEWTFACEGETRVPYPYGYERDKTACNIDRAHGFPNFEAFSEPKEVSKEVERLDQRVRSGSMPRCVSPFGVHDMTGNVDEWARNPAPDRDAGVDISSLKGGYFGPIRARCRPVTRSHNRWFRFYQVGFRCCRDVE